MWVKNGTHGHHSGRVRSTPWAIDLLTFAESHYLENFFYQFAWIDSCFDEYISKSSISHTCASKAYCTNTDGGLVNSFLTKTVSQIVIRLKFYRPAFSYLIQAISSSNFILSAKIANRLKVTSETPHLNRRSEFKKREMENMGASIYFKFFWQTYI